MANAVSGGEPWAAAELGGALMDNVSWPIEQFSLLAVFESETGVSIVPAYERAND